MSRIGFEGLLQGCGSLLELTSMKFVLTLLVTQSSFVRLLAAGRGWWTTLRITSAISGFGTPKAHSRSTFPTESTFLNETRCKLMDGATRERLLEHG